MSGSGVVLKRVPKRAFSQKPFYSRRRERQSGLDDTTTKKDPGLTEYDKPKRNYAGWVGVGANLVTITLFGLFISERTEQQSIQAWSILASEGGANMGKSLALTTLFANGENLEFLDLSCKKSSKGDCESGAVIRDVDLSPRLKYVPFDISYAELERLPFHDLWLPEITTVERNGDVEAQSWFRRLNIRGATLTGVTFKAVDLRGANLDRVEFSKAVLADSKLDHTLLSYANFHQSAIIGNSFHRAQAHVAMFDNATLNENDFTLSSLRFARFFYAAVCSNNFTMSDMSFTRAYTTVRGRYNFYRFGEPPVIGDTKKLLGMKLELDGLKGKTDLEPNVQSLIKDSEGLEEYLLSPREFDFVALDPADDILSKIEITPTDFEKVAKAVRQIDEIASGSLLGAASWLATGGTRYYNEISPVYPDGGCDAPMIVFPYDEDVAVSFKDQRAARELTSLP